WRCPGTPPRRTRPGSSPARCSRTRTRGCASGPGGSSRTPGRPWRTPRRRAGTAGWSAPLPAWLRSDSRAVRPHPGADRPRERRLRAPPSESLRLELDAEILVVAAVVLVVRELVAQRHVLFVGDLRPSGRETHRVFADGP